MLSKKVLKKRFSKNWKKEYQVKLFKEKGFVRKKCRCGNHFWTLDQGRKTCGDATCEDYGFIGSPITKVKWDYVETWKQFAKFFRKEGHTEMHRYPVVDRWRPDLYFTVASVQDFQRIDKGNLVWEYPADPLVVPQMCLRFGDIPNVGVTGRHHTCFMMPGQHSFGEYWKDKTIELNFKFLNGVMGIPEKDLTYIEDVWAMPDFSGFGPSMETVSKGLELVNSVFTQYTSPDRKMVKELPLKVIDVGWGHERMVWFSNGTLTGYEAVFGPVIEWMKNQTGLKPDELFQKYSALAGRLNFDEVSNMRKAKESIAKKLGVDVKALYKSIEPLQGLYAIADHTKALLFAVTDGGIPSNVGGGYNLRVILRRALSFMQEFNFNFSLMDVAERHARHMKPLFPELKQGLESLSQVLEVEQGRYQNTVNRASLLIQKELKKGKLTTDKLVQFYTSNGISPEMVEKAAAKEKVPFSVPEDFYVKLTAQHASGDKGSEKEKLGIDIKATKPTRLIYYEHPTQTEFTARVVDRIGDWIALDETLFYPTGGGQPSDLGILRVANKTYQVEDVQKIGDVVLHKVRGPKIGHTVTGEIDWERRFRLMQMHTATHIIAGSARKVLGNHIWQAGAQKGVESSRIDLTHFRPFTQEEIKKIEDQANEVVKSAVPVETKVMPRSKAEQKYGFVLYQGGASPGKELRVVSVKGVDVEACGGMHLFNTKHVETIRIVKSERIQDGVNRLEFTCSQAARQFLHGQEELFDESVKELEKNLDVRTYFKFKEKDIPKAAEALSVEPAQLPKTIEKFSKELKERTELIKKSGRPVRGYLAISDARSLAEASKALFELWKLAGKETGKVADAVAEEQAKSLMGKVKGCRITEIVHGEREELIKTAAKLIELNPELTIILANERGEVIGMSRKEDMGKIVKEICTNAGGSGGGRPELAQGKAELSKLLKVLNLK